MKFIPKLFLVFGLIQGIVSCHRDIDNCNSTKIGWIDSAFFSNTVSANQEFIVTTYVFAESGCAKSPTGFYSVSNGELLIGMDVLYEGCECTAIAGSVRADLKVIVEKPGKYLVKIRRAENQYFTDTLWVN
jgi:hypothetical protein